MLSPDVRRLPAHVGLDGVQRLDAPQRLRGEASVVAAVLDVQIPPRPARMRPACCLCDPAAVVEVAPAAIGVGLQSPSEPREMAAWMFALSIGRVAVPGRGRRMVSGGPVITHVDPQPPGARLARAGRQHLHRRVVGMHLLSGQHVAPQCRHQRVEQVVDLPDPADHRGAVDLHARAPVDAALPV